MHIIFTDEEMEWLDTSKSFDWKIKDECPQRIKEILNKKMELLKNKGNEQSMKGG